MKTPHFHIYFHQRLYRLALRVARIAEESYALLTPYAGYTPKGRVHVILYDDIDAANGSATALPRNTITLFATPPEARGELNDSDDWMRGLFYHEYLHILHLDTKSEVFVWVNRVLGKRLAPNMLMPRWWIEGWAVFVETYFTGGGRNRSSFYDMYLRAAVLEKQPLRLDQVTNGPLRFPRGTSAYLYGSRFLYYLENRFGLGTLTKISQTFGDALLPYGMNAAVERVLKKRYDQLWQEWLKHLRRKYGKLKARVMRHALTPVRRLTSGGEWLSSLRYLPGGRKIMLYRNDPHRIQRLEVVDRRTKKRRRLMIVNGASIFGMDRRAKIAVIGQSETSYGVFNFYDLYAFSPGTKRPTLRRLTHSARAREPDVSPDGRHLVFVRYGQGQTSLWMMDLRNLKRPMRLIHRPATDVVITMPRFSPNGRRIVCSVWFPGGNRDIMLFDRRTKRWRRLTRDRAQDIEPVFSPDGREIIFSSDPDGIYNLYAIRLKDGRRRRLTNELYGAFAPAISPKGKFLAFLRFGVKGFDLVETTFSQQPQPYPLPTVRKFWPRKRYPKSRQVYPVRPYDASATLAPLQWLPLISSDYRGTTLGIGFSGNDILNFHAYSLNAWLGLDSLEPGYRLTYRYDRLYPTLSFGQGIFTRNASAALSINGEGLPFPERVIYGSVSASIPISRALFFQSLSLGYEANYLHPLQTRFPLRLDDLPPRLPETGFFSTLSLSWFFSNTFRYPLSISTERGRQLFLSLRLQHPWLGSNALSWSVRGSWSEYLSMPWGRHQVLALKLDAAVGRTSWRVRPLFFVGGVPEQDLFDALLSGSRVGSGYLRGYRPFQFRGNGYVLLQSEYRIPIVDIERGVSLLPFFLRRLHMVFFADAGQAFDALPSFDATRVGVGGELRLEWSVGYYLFFTLRFGYAKGLMKEGIDQLYLVLGNSF